MGDLPDFAALRERMVERDIAGRGITDPAILDAFRWVPREMFVQGSDRAAAYADGPLPIAAGQTVSQPYIVALMSSAAGLRPDHAVLEIGAGSGYAAAILGRIVRRVVAIERHRILALAAADRMGRLDIENVSVVHGDGLRGWPEEAPYDAILLSAAGDEVPQALLDQLRPGGCLVMPIGAPDAVQRLLRVTRKEKGSFRRDDLGGVRFVPLLPGLSD